jgi:ATP-binding cassette subfamily B protein
VTSPTTAKPDAQATQLGGWQAFRRLLSFLGPYRRQLMVSALLAVLVAVARMAIPYITGKVIDDIHEAKFDDIGRQALLLVAAAGVVAVLNASRRLVAGTISLGLEKTLRDRLFGHLGGLSFSFFDRHQTGQLLSRATVDVTQVRFFLGYGLTYFFMHAATLIGVPIIVIWISPALAAVVLVMMPLVFLVSRRYSRLTTPIQRRKQQREADVTQAAEENIVGARVVRAFGQEHAETQRFRQRADRIVDAELESLRIEARYKPLYSVLPNLALATCVVVAAHEIARDALTIGQFFAVYGYLLLLTGPVRIVGNLLSRAQRATASGQRLFELLDDDERLPQVEHPRELPAVRGSSEVRFEGVTFGYREGAPVIRDLDLVVPAGSTVAVLGATGSGKTTLTALVPRFYDPWRGRVLMDGIDVRELDLHELRRAVGIVNQEPTLFSATVAENLRFGAPDATEEQLWQALEDAQATDFVRRLPQGLETRIGERGLTLSGGQRQRIAIARALLVDPRVLILDDATASVDARVEARITQALHTAASSRTTILIAHRPSTIALADHIVLLARGRVSDQGTHDELLARSDEYRQIYEQRQVVARREFLLDNPAGPSDEERADLEEAATIEAAPS